MMKHLDYGKLNELRRDGWLEFEVANDDRTLVEIASELGTIISHSDGSIVKYLIPKSQAKAKRNTMSSKYGLQKFPFHTDTAFKYNPVRYILFSCDDMSTAATNFVVINELLQRLNESEKLTLKNSIFLVKGITSTFYSSLIADVNLEFQFRFDRDCMIPANNSAKKSMLIIENILNKAHVHRCNWDRSKVLILDNWGTLHSRGEVDCKENRIIKRIYIEKLK